MPCTPILQEAQAEGQAAAGPDHPVPGIATAGATLAAAALLAACGGSDPAPPEAFFRTGQAPTRRILGSAQSAALPAPTATDLLDWAEQAYAGYFPGSAADQVLAPYVYRHYPVTGNYVGVADNDVYVLGPVSGGGLLRVGSLADFAAAVAASRHPDEAQASRFLQQASFGATDADIAAVRAQGPAAWLAAQMALPRGERAWDWLMARGFGDVDARALVDIGGPTVDYALAREVSTAADAVRKRVSLALTEYFVVSALVAQMPWTGLGMAHYWDQLNDHAFGNFRDLLEAMTLNPTMGAWLNTRGNLKEDPSTGRVPDENYAREVMQLFTIGLVQLNPDGTVRRDAQGRPLNTYTQDDVTQLARIFTGWDWWDDGRRFIVQATNNGRPYPEYTRRAMVFDAGKHSQRASVVMGRAIPAGADGLARLRTALDILFQHPNVGPFFGRQMIQRLVTSNPSPAYVARVAAVFADNGAGVRGDLKAVWRAILLDDEARGSAGLTSPTHGKVREPMVRMFQWARSFGARSVSGLWNWGFNYASPLEWYGQRPLWSPSVFNFFRPGYVPPGTAMAAAGATAPEFQILNESTVCQWVNAIDNLNLSAGTIQNAFGDIAIDLGTERALAPDAAALVQRLNLLLAAGQLSAQTEQRLIEILELAYTGMPATADDTSRRYRVVAAITMVMSCPEYLVQK